MPKLTRLARSVSSVAQPSRTPLVALCAAAMLCLPLAHAEQAAAPAKPAAPQLIPVAPNKTAPLADAAVLAAAFQQNITAGDLNADLARLAPDVRAKAVTDPATVQQATTNLLVRRALAERAQKTGLDKQPMYQAQLRLLQDRLLSDAWLAKVDADNVLPDAEVERLAQLKYQSEAFSRFKQPGQIKVRHILLNKDEGGKARAQELLKEIKAGGDFAELAKANSKDPGSAARGGDLGLVAPGRMVPDFEKAAFALEKAGDVSEIVETGFGYHIIKLDERLPEKIASFNEVREGLKNEVLAKARNDARNASAADLFKAVEINEANMIQFIESARSATATAPTAPTAP